jgi:N-acyl-D-aspartate/D-glutamate deacylase
VFDLIVKNAIIIDGTGNEGYKGDVAIEYGKIVEIGKLEKQYHDAKNIVDAEGKILSPGFIDVHGHTDMFVFMDPGCGAKLKQGITTEISGQCGITVFPVTKEYWEVYQNYYKKMGAPVDNDYLRFSTADSYLTEIEKTPIGINLGLFVGHGTIRMAVMGLSPERPDSTQMEKMKSLTKEAMESGAFGLSSGIMYAPGSFSTKEEIAELCKIVSEKGGIYTSHIRNQGELLEECVAETIDIGKSTGVSVNISHHKAVGRSNWGKVVSSSAMIDQANERGVNVTHDVYPYTASSTTLSATLPPSCLKEGVEKLIMNLGDEGYIKELEYQIFNPTEQWDNDLKESGYESLLIIRAPKTPEAIGKTIEQYADLLGVERFKAYIHLLLENELDVSDICFSMVEEDVQYLIEHDKCMFGTDSLYIPGMPMTHPRSIGTFPRILGRYVRENNILPLEKAIHKMTGLAAQVYGIEGKGKVEIGYDADLVVFNQKTIIDHSKYTDPIRDNEGIDYVIVNGKIAVEDNRLTDVRAGKLIRK